MNRMMFFAAGMIAGIGVTLVGGHDVFPGVEAAPGPRLEKPLIKPLPKAEPEFLEQRCAPGFKHSPNNSGRYTCNRIAAVRCPDGRAAQNLQLYRSGAAMAADARLLFQCQMSETVRPRCGRGFQAASLKLYRSGGMQGDSRLIYECVQYRKGN
jgi:hypothetical protein